MPKALFFESEFIRISALYLLGGSTSREHVEEFSEGFYASLVIRMAVELRVRGVGGDRRELIRGRLRAGGVVTESEFEWKTVEKDFRSSSNENLLWNRRRRAGERRSSYLPECRGGSFSRLGLELRLQLLDELVVRIYEHSSIKLTD